MPIPPLVTILVSEREQKGAELTRAEVLAIRDKAVCMALPRSKAEALAQARGYADLDPENVWEDWQHFTGAERDRSVAG